jgi:hypothetical protein
MCMQSKGYCLPNRARVDSFTRSVLCCTLSTIATSQKLSPFLARVKTLVLDETSQIWDMLSCIALQRLPALVNTHSFLFTEITICRSASLCLETRISYRHTS